MGLELLQQDTLKKMTAKKKKNTTSRNRDVLMQTDGTMEIIRHLSKTKQGKIS